MKNKAGFARKIRYGGITAVLTAAIIAIVIIINVMFTALAHKKLWYTDLTPDVEFTLTETCISYMKNGDPTFEESTSPIEKINDFREELRRKNETLPEEARLTEEQIIEQTQIEIIFCDDELQWHTDDMARKYVWKTAADLALEFPDYIKLTYVNIYRNPTAVNKYEEQEKRVTSSSDVVIRCGNQTRIKSLQSFYYMEDETVVAYNGEKVFVSAFMAITRAKSPKLCFTMGHGEETSKNLGNAFVTLLENSGYELDWIDLTKEDIPEDCRLMIIFEPTGDFVVADGLSDKDELKKIDEFLANDNSLMVFMSSSITTPLNNLEEYLEEWGISFERKQSDSGYHPYRVQDNDNSFDEYGFNVKGEYVTYGLGNDISSPVRAEGKTMIFPNAMPISYSHNVNIAGYRDTDDGPVLGNYGKMTDDGQYRDIYDIFTSGKTAKAVVDGGEDPNKGNLFKLMTISVQDRLVQEDNYGISTIDKASYVIACGCPEFASNEALTGSYGNSDFLSYTLRKVGHEPVPVGLSFRMFGDYTIDIIETKDVRTYTLVLTLVPAILSLGVGIVVLVRRKNR